MYFLHLPLELTDEDLLELRSVAPDAAILTSIEGSDTDTASESEQIEDPEELPEPLTALFEPTLNPTDIAGKCEEAYLNIKRNINPEQCKRLEQKTKQQANCQDWHTHREGRITSTTFHSVCTGNGNSISQSTLKKIMRYDDVDLQVPAVVWGREQEEKAREWYTKEVNKSHQNAKVTLCGFVVCSSEPHLGASPDARVVCDCCGEGVVEIKSPYKYRDGLMGVTVTNDFCLDHNYDLKKTHPYYYQVQLHMYVCNVQYCDFIVWTTPEVFMCRIPRDEQLLLKALPVAKQCYLSCILPEVLTRSQDPALKPPVSCYTCNMPEVGKMIKCKMCNHIFHYQCVQVKRKLKNWHCSLCR